MACLSFSSARLENAGQFIRHMHRGLPDLRLTVDDIVTSGAEVWLRWTLRGTQTGPLFDLDRTGKHASVSGLMVILFENGKIIESWASWNVLSLMQQLGYLLSIEAIGRRVESMCA